MSKKPKSAIVDSASEDKLGKAFISQRAKIDFDLNIREFPYTEKQKAFIELVERKDTKIVFLEGPAGTAKTHLSALCGLRMLNMKRADQLIFIRTIVESASKSLGFLPGTLEEKIGPFLMPLMDKLEELLSKSQSEKLLKDERIKGMPINHLRGASFNVKYIILEEAQNFSFQELTTALTRIGNHSKMLVIGDPMQADLYGQSGFKKMIDIFNDEQSRNEGIHCVKFDRSDIVRSGVLHYIIEKLESAPRETRVKEKPFQVDTKIEDWAPKL
jgi:phosphate starvation-inducible PhoH-like protein